MMGVNARIICMFALDEFFSTCKEHTYTELHMFMGSCVTVWPEEPLTCQRRTCIFKRIRSKLSHVLLANSPPVAEFFDMKDNGSNHCLCKSFFPERCRSGAALICFLTASTGVW